MEASGRERVVYIIAAVSAMCVDVLLLCGFDLANT